MIDRRKSEKASEAVSPVVGVMLMLVVTIIIAAVVSAYAGGLSTGEKKAPVVELQTQIGNAGSYSNSYFTMKVLSVSEPISTRDLKIITSWRKSDGTTGGNTSVAGKINFNFQGGRNIGTAPVGLGPGVENWSVHGNTTPTMHWGNFTLMGGTSIMAHPIGVYSPMDTGGYGPPGSEYTYVAGTYYQPGDVDHIMGVLGSNWYRLRPGDRVSVKVLHVPTGKVIYDTDVVVEG